MNIDANKKWLALYVLCLGDVLIVLDCVRVTRVGRHCETIALQPGSNFLRVDLIARTSQCDEVHCRRWRGHFWTRAGSQDGELGEGMHGRPSMTDDQLPERSDHQG